ncbi:MAG TPA: alpha-L-rhamnosidase C-terminal domain-containing protein, partial [Verrucomicrobiae bacterium]|nr:alpha-L-rhamnosidase C-terminal domain-containing protein [Verrucomicrobiae bacterium]
LAAASGSITTDRGMISVFWHANTNRFNMTVGIPANVTATVMLPLHGSTNTTMFMDGSPLPGIATNNYLVVSGVGSGTHAFATVYSPTPQLAATAAEGH